MLAGHLNDMWSGVAVVLIEAALIQPSMFDSAHDAYASLSRSNEWMHAYKKVKIPQLITHT